MFYNLSSSAHNADGSTTFFGSGGNAINTLEPDGSSIVFAQPVSAMGAAAPVWFAPGPPSTTILNSVVSGGSAFQSMMSGVSVFKLYEIMLALPDSILRSFFSYLNSKHISLAIEAEPLVASQGQPGYGVESFSESASDLTTLLTKIKTDGGNLSYVAWDEPWACGYSSGILSLSKTASEVAAATNEVHELFPQAIVGDIEPVGRSPTETAALQTWFSAYAQAAGSPFSFLQEDIGGWNPGWETALAADTKIAHQNGMSVGAIIDGAWNSPSATAWAAQAVSMAQQIMSDPSTRADYLVVQSWQTTPSETMDPTIPGTLASVALDVENGTRSASAAPAMAQYSASGSLQNVVWSGGWTAFQNGSSLVFSSPSGAVVQQYASSTIRAFSFNAATGIATVTVCISPATSTRPEADVTYQVSITAGGFVFAPVVL